MTLHITMTYFITASNHTAQQTNPKRCVSLLMHEYTIQAWSSSVIPLQYHPYENARPHASLRRKLQRKSLYVSRRGQCRGQRERRWKKTLGICRIG